MAMRKGKPDRYRGPDINGNPYTVTELLSPCDNPECCPQEPNDDQQQEA